mmetsp:Transcript_4772/g.7205  ORF Transcript_4772/g.7205 Transcript_4772/m.7205 type:complete len:112 (-) Transcript_4772:57-392(-)
MNLNMSQYIGELFRQFVSLKRVVDRNQALSDADYQAADESLRFRIPFILLKFLPNSDVGILRDKRGENLELDSKKPFELMNENHLLAGMGMSRLQGEEDRDYLRQIIDGSN